MPPVAWIRNSTHCLMHAISKAHGSVKFWYDALDLVVSPLACFYRTSSKRICRLWRKGRKFCFSRCHGVRWVEAIFHELDIVLQNLPAVLLHLLEYITNETHLGHRAKAEDLLVALLHPPFRGMAARFLRCFCCGLCISKKVQTTRGAQVDAGV